MTTIISRNQVRPILMSLACLALTGAVSGAQTGPVPLPVRPKSALYSAPSTAKVRSQQPKALVNIEALPLASPSSVDFGSVPLGEVELRVGTVDVPTGNPIVDFEFKDKNGNDLSSLFKAEKKKNDAACSDKASVASGKCTILIGFSPADDHTSFAGTLNVEYLDRSSKTFDIAGSGIAAAPCKVRKSVFLPLTHGFKPGDLYPVLPADIPDDFGQEVYHDFGDPIRKTEVNCFYASNTSFSYFNQFQSIYNAASGSTTLNAQLGSLNFSNGMQLTIATNPQVGSANSNSTTPATTAPVAVPTLSAASAAQAAQNVLNGGTIFGFNLFPLISRQGDAMITLDAVAREGVDLQKFNNTSITATNPSTHTFAGLQGYFQYNSSNSAANSTGPAGSIFLGAMYGYNLMNHSYSLENGFGGRVNTQIAQISAGVLLNGVVKLAASRGFGPSQRYIDSSSMMAKTANNFQTWSIAIAYQSSGSGKTK